MEGLLPIAATKREGPGQLLPLVWPTMAVHRSLQVPPPPPRLEIPPPPPEGGNRQFVTALALPPRGGEPSRRSGGDSKGGLAAPYKWSAATCSSFNSHYSPHHPNSRCHTKVWVSMVEMSKKV